MQSDTVEISAFSRLAMPAPAPSSVEQARRIADGASRPRGRRRAVNFGEADAPTPEVVGLAARLLIEREAGRGRFLSAPDAVRRITGPTG